MAFENEKNNETSGEAAVKPLKALLQSVACYIADYYVDVDAPAEPYAAQESCRSFGALPEKRACKSAASFEEAEDAAIPYATSLEEMLQQADAGFSERLLQLIDQRGSKDAEIYKKANISKQHFSKMRNNPDYRPTKPTAVALALALELDVEKTNDLIGRAGFTLSNSSKFDLIIRYCIENRIYDIVQINMVLYEFDQPLLGS